MLKQLVIKAPFEVNDPIFTIINELSTLELLSIQNLNFHESNSELILTNYKPKLKYLELEYIKLSQINLQLIASSCPNLELVYLLYINLQDDDLIFLFERLSKLKAIKLLIDKVQLSYEFLARIPDILPNLEFIEIFYFSETNNVINLPYFVIKLINLS